MKSKRLNLLDFGLVLIILWWVIYFIFLIYTDYGFQPETEICFRSHLPELLNDEENQLNRINNGTFGDYTYKSCREWRDKTQEELQKEQDIKYCNENLGDSDKCVCEQETETEFNALCEFGLYRLTWVKGKNVKQTEYECHSICDSGYCGEIKEIFYFPSKCIQAIPKTNLEIYKEKNPDCLGY
ncbi:MAG: hypothetical protein AABY22_15320, partial [Nanoarchaeota archaeon]